MFCGPAARGPSTSRTSSSTTRILITSGDLLLYRLTLEAQKLVAATPLARREISRRLRTSPAQLSRLLDQTNDRKSVDQMLRLLQALECDVELVVRARSA